MTAIRLERYSYRFAEQVLNAKLSIKQEVETILTDDTIDIASLSRPTFNKVLRESFIAHGWQDQPYVFQDDNDPAAKMDFLKERVGIEVGFGHASFLGIDLLKFQVSSYSGLDQIDVGIYVTTTTRFQKYMAKEHDQKWEGSLTFEKVKRYLPHFKSAIQVPIYVLGIDV
jgi:Restriction endonuclease BglII